MLTEYQLWVDRYRTVAAGSVGSLGDGKSKEGTLEGFHAGQFFSQRVEEECTEVVQRTDLSCEAAGGQCRCLVERSSPRKGRWQGGWRNKKEK